MNNRTAHILFKVFFDKNAQGISFGGAPAFLPEEIDLFLNQGQNDTINNKISGNNPLQLGFESSALRISELDKLVCTDSNLLTLKALYNEFVLDNVHKDGERLTVIGVVLKYGKHLANCLIVDHASVAQFRLTYNNTPWVENPMAILEDNKLLIYVDPILMQTEEYAPVNGKYAANVTYIKQPKQFNYKEPLEELDLSDKVMGEVISRAVVLALENIESTRTLGKLQLNQLSE